jgi:hypothetical protein
VNLREKGLILGELSGSLFHLMHIDEHKLLISIVGESALGLFLCLDYVGLVKLMVTRELLGLRKCAKVLGTGRSVH